MGLRARAVGAAVLVLAGVAAPSAHAFLLANGDFEAHPNNDASTTTFTGWTESNGGTAVVAATPLAGASSARFVGGVGGSVTQNLLSTANQFTFTLNFAALAPTNNGADRTMNIILQEATAGGQVNFRIVRSADAGTLGDVQVFDNAVFQTILTDVVNFSSDLATPVVNTLTISGTFNDTPSSSYVVNVNGTNSTARTDYQGGTGQPANLARVTFATINGTNVDYVVDNVVVTPEPGSATLAADAASLLLARRRRSA
jgi:hypothetical protein